MKRQIVCEKCGARPIKDYAGEWWKRKDGLARMDFICDLCGEPIKKDAKCHAESLGRNDTPYYRWEEGFIKTVDWKMMPSSIIIEKENKK